MTVRTGSYAKIEFPPTIGHDLLNVQTDIYTKVLKLQRQQQKRDTKDAKTPSGIGKKSSISEIALIYGSALAAGILGILIYMFYVMDTQ